ncbi:MAG: 16S rRNA (adenine(1518)-N(6)/adenine(1519)-N(6))-dimethyltransferase RsmA [Thermoplasmata archaeon]|nr:16S rRNA (adenine(1518)-N(6)/adenine(1519)-N(6))-dimethyltransferase RsmA [Thermoplasmata archaeon]
MRVQEVKTILESMGKRPSRRLGQHFLIDDRVITRQVALAHIKPGERVLEVGPGIGNLTEAILSAGAEVVAVEADSAFCRFLERRFGQRISLLHADAVKAFLPEFDKVVANLPYQISSPMTFKLLELGFDMAVLMVQREFAERMVAGPGTRDYGRLTVGVHYRARCEIAFNVSKASFWPQPGVNSSVVMLTPRKPAFTVADERVFHDVTKAIFSHRRKKVMNALANDSASLAYLSGVETPSFAGLPYASSRAEQLTPAEIGELSDAFLELINSSKRNA